MPNMYEALKEGITKETKVATEVTNIEDAYENLYHLVSRLRDMDDFSETILTDLYKVSKASDFLTAFKQIIDSEYGLADSNYFIDSAIQYESDLEEALEKAVNSDAPVKSWEADINWLADHAVISLNGTDKTLEQLRNEIERRG